jgi:hypothetical protein
MDTALFREPLGQRVPQVGSSPLKGADINGTVPLDPVADAFAQVITDPPANAGKRVFLQKNPEGGIEVGVGRMEKRHGNIVARRTRDTAWRHLFQVLRPP